MNAATITILCLLAGGAARAGGPADATIDLATRAGCALTKAEWRYSDTKIVEVDFRGPGPDKKPSGAPNRTYDYTPHAQARDFDDSHWEVIDPERLDGRRSTGRMCFNWYRTRIEIPAKIGDFDPTGSTVVFEIVVDDAAEVWVNGELPRELCQTGGRMAAGYDVPNRLIVARDAVPGEKIQLAVFGMNGPVSASPENFIWVRSARLDFYRDRPADLSYRGATTIDRRDPRLDAILPRGTVLERLADGFRWTEGPLWVQDGGYLLFSDVKKNAIYRWREGAGESLYLKPSGYTGAAPFAGVEPGSNGLALDRDGLVVMCEHGDRRITRLGRDGKKTVIADRWQGKRLNSPNDLVFKGNGDLYFTDPPFGLPRTFDDPGRETEFCGVYCVRRTGEVVLLTKEVHAPNGIAFSPDETKLYVSNADRSNPVLLEFPVRPDGTLGASRVLWAATEWARIRPGIPDGMKVDARGNIFLAGPGGLYVLAPDGTVLGLVEMGALTANCALAPDGSIYICASTAIYRLRGDGADCHR